MGKDASPGLAGGKASRDLRPLLKVRLEPGWLPPCLGGSEGRVAGRAAPDPPAESEAEP